MNIPPVLEEPQGLSSEEGCLDAPDLGCIPPSLFATLRNYINALEHGCLKLLASSPADGDTCTLYTRNYIDAKPSHSRPGRLIFCGKLY